MITLAFVRRLPGGQGPAGGRLPRHSGQAAALRGQAAAAPAGACLGGLAAHNGCASASTVMFQQGDVSGETWGHCCNSADVTLYTIAGKGHSWPGSAMPAQIITRDIDATDVIWEFFAAHPKP